MQCTIYYIIGPGAGTGTLAPLKCTTRHVLVRCAYTYYGAAAIKLVMYVLRKKNTTATTAEKHFPSSFCSVLRILPLGSQLSALGSLFFIQSAHTGLYFCAYHAEKQRLEDTRILAQRECILAFSKVCLRVYLLSNWSSCTRIQSYRMKKYQKGGRR